eukprot:scaffold18839_cov61-Cyclotella_meneghiniana.AAC.7
MMQDEIYSEQVDGQKNTVSAINIVSQRDVQTKAMYMAQQRKSLKILKIEKEAMAYKSMPVPKGPAGPTVTRLMMPSSGEICNSQFMGQTNF